MMTNRRGVTRVTSHERVPTAEGRPLRVRGYSPGTPCWAELSTGDPDRSAAFYRDLFGWQARARGDGSVEFTLRELVVAGAAPVAGGERPLGWLVHIATDDAASVAAAVTGAGGRVLRPPVDVGTRGRAAVFTDPQRATFAVWQRGTFAGAQLGSEPGTVSWSEVTMRDPRAAGDFYGKVFGWVERPGELITAFDYREWGLHGRVVAGMVPMTDDLYPPHLHGHWRVSIDVAGCQETVDRCAALGGRVVAGPMDVGIGTYAYLLDPLGAGFGVIELLPALRQPY
jgi:uncharacterized protein